MLERNVPPCFTQFLEAYPSAEGMPNADTNFSWVLHFLEDRMRTYAELATIETRDCQEPLVAIEGLKYVSARQIGTDMQAVTGDDILVRETVLQKLGNAAEALQKQKQGAALEVVYGYRTNEIQTKLFEMIRSAMHNTGFRGTEESLLEEVHRKIAVPSVAGHPTGGAVDVQILENGSPLDMGSDIWDFDTTNAYTFSPYISPVAWQNRQLLREIMVGEGFVPFDGEWWHFSYGDTEWAAANGAPCAIYGQR